MVYETEKGYRYMKTGISYIWKDRKRFLGMPLSFTRYSLSEDRLFLQKGLLNIKFEEIVLYRVTDLTLSIHFGQRIFGVGTVVVHSSDKTTPHFELKNVKHPILVKELLHKQVEAMKIQRRVRVGELIDNAAEDLEEDCCGTPDDILPLPDETN